jgi:hypothetical protein
MTDQPAREPIEERGILRRELRFWEAIALSIGIMAPMAAMALNASRRPASLVARSPWRSSSRPSPSRSSRTPSFG